MMVNLVKQNFLILSPYAYIGIILGMMVAFLLAIPASFIFVVCFFAIVFSLYLYDDKNNVHQYIISLPVKKQDMILGRYIYSLIIALFLMLILWGWMGILSLTSLLTESHYVYNWRDIIVMFSFLGLMIAIGSPILYRLSFYLSSIIIFFLIGLGSFIYISEIMKVLGRDDADADVILFNDMDSGLSLLAEKYIPFQPYIILIAGTFVLLYISMLLSTFIVKRSNM